MAARLSPTEWRPVLLLACAAAVLAPAAPASAEKQNQDKTCGNTRLDIGFVDTLFGALNENGEGKIGPRRLVVSQSGKIVSKGTRLFRGSVPMDIDSATVKIVKTDGKGKTSVAICATATGADQRQTVLKTFEIPNGKSNIGSTYTRTVSGLRGKRVSVYLKGKSVTDTMSYKLYFERPGAGDVWEPDPDVFDDKPDPVSGFADLHAHHSGATAFASGWYHGGISDADIAPDPLEHSERFTVNLAGLPIQELRPAHTGLAVPSWNVDSHQQMAYGALESAADNGLGLIVAPAVNSEWLCSVLSYAGTTDPTQTCNDMESAKLQIKRLKDFDEDHDWYRIVTDPWEALDARRRGQLAVVLGIEVSNLFPSSDGDWKRQLDELYDMGVRQAYVAHETNNRFAGAAYHHTEDLKLPNQLTAWFSDEIEYASQENANRNAVGLTDLGKDLIRELIARHMLIDVDHASWKAVDGIATITKRKDYYPLYAGHSRINGLLTPEHKELIPELNTPPRIRTYIRERGGMIGIRTGPDRSQQYADSGVTESCGGSVTSLIQHYRFIADQKIPAAFGSDFNGFVQMTAPRFGDDACPDAPAGQRTQQKEAQTVPSSNGAPPNWQRYKDRGMSDIGTEPAVIFDMKKLGVDTSNIESSTDAFIRMWIRAYDPDRRIVRTPMIGQVPLQP